MGFDILCVFLLGVLVIIPRFYMRGVYSMGHFSLLSFFSFSLSYPLILLAVALVKLDTDLSSL